MYVFDSTVAGNTIGGAHVFSATNKDVQLRRSILWQPGTTVLARSGGSLAVESLLASDLGGFSGATGSGVAPMMANPRFVDPEHSDYSLRAASPAIDLAAAIAGDDRDVLGLPRDVDLPIRVNFAGPRDLGAFERQSLQPMVLNGDFDAPDLRLWSPVMAGVTTRDTTQNASGAPGSASAHIARTNAGSGQETHGLSQCIHLPGPARYLLNGWGRSTGLQPRDSARLYWEYRRNGGEDCTGAPDRFGWHHLSSGEWRQPAEPAFIDVAGADWGNAPSIKVTLVAVEAGVTVTNTTHAWFDGITLEAVSLDDVIFANGFEP